ncbi:BNA2 [Candida theae]|uniref:Indoleamine 2,3-dioxygenase n=1 Tax=Candida theae TaxID=1198502 RepID=A0AAD5FX47_9ASCO|nr:BNA2 [Candida theae]KAI5950705.1 BNA2 [Candida theae]
MIPTLEEFDVSPETGFLPSELPLERLPQDYYKPWEDIVHNLPSYIMNRRIRAVVDKLPVLTTDGLSVREQRRAYQVLSFIGHAYIWTGEPVDKLPSQIAVPWVAVSQKLGLPPIGTYSGLCLWNYKKIDEEGDFTLDNLTTINTFTGGIDESWFYLVSVWFEKEGSFCLRKGLEALKGAERGSSTVTTSLQQLAESIDILGSHMMLMEEMCDPHIFYFRMRPYLAGWKNMASVGLEKGVRYGDEEGMRSYAGGSNAQSSLIQFFDILLGVAHDDSFIREMREYMPREHREFLEALEPYTFTIRDFVQSQHDEALTLAYDACLAMLKSFRDKHIQIVTRYIVLQAKKVNKMGSTIRSGLARQKKEEKGTGGTSLLPFLKQCRDETGSAAAGSWGKRILTDGMLRLKYSKSNGVNED